ncbi:MAG TPA: cytochrome c [Steroidobacteraceae bacterium]|nr:cytochrome c [Steroidobacteraceae bacterium]
MTRRLLRATVALAAAAAAPLAAGAAEAPAPAYPQGAASFQTTCAVCHGSAGAGLPGLAPPLLSYPARYAASPEGRRQLAMTVLYGMYGDIAVEGKHYAFQMPGFGQLDDASLAALLNFVVFDLAHAPPGVAPLAPAELAAERAHPLDGAAVREHRKSVAPVEP